MAGSGNNIEQFDKQTASPGTQQDLHLKLHSEGYDSSSWTKGGSTIGGKLPAGFGGFLITGLDNEGRAQNEGFQKEAPYQHDGLTGLWNGLKHIVGANDSVEDKLKEGVYKSLPKSEQEAIDKERAQQRSDLVSTIVVDKRSYEEKYPHLAKLDQQVRKEEDAISKQVLSGMSPEDRARLKQQEDAYYKIPEIRNPAGTGEGFRPRPEAGPMLKEYWDRIAEATQKRYGS